MRGVGEVSAEYRQKLVNWLTSMLVLPTIILVNWLYNWFTRVQILLPSQEDGFQLIARTMVSPAESFAYFLPILLLWHFADFLQQNEPSNRWVANLTNYRWVVWLLVLIGASTLFNQTGWLNGLGCPEVNVPGGFDGCGSWTPFWKLLIGAVCFLALLAAAFLKTLLMLAQRATPLRKWALSILQRGDKVNP